MPARKRILLEAVLAGVVAGLLGSATLIYPFGRDQAQYAAMAAAAREGKVIYRDVFNYASPPGHLVHELAVALFGHSMLAIRLLDLFWQVATAVLLVLAGTRCGGSPAGLLAAGLYALWYFAGDFWTTAQADGFLTLPVALAGVWFLAASDAPDDRAPWTLAACGAALGTAALFKYPIGVMLPLLCGWTWYRGRAARGRTVLALVLGFGAPFLAGAVWLAIQGALLPFLEIQARSIPAYVLSEGTSPYLASLLPNLARHFTSHPAFALSFFAAAGELLHASRRGTLARVVPLLLWWAAAVIHLAVQNKFFAYHALPMLAPQALLFAHVGVAAWRAVGRSALLRAGLAALAAGVVGWTYQATGYPGRHGAFRNVATGRLPLESVYASPDFGPPSGPGHSAGANLELARYLAARTAPSERIFVWGFEPAIYFLARRGAATRFLVSFPLYAAYGWPELRTVLLQELEEERPVYFVVCRDSPVPWVTGNMLDPEAAFSAFDALREFVRSRYELEIVMGSFSVYRRQS